AADVDAAVAALPPELQAVGRDLLADREVAATLREIARQTAGNPAVRASLGAALEALLVNGAIPLLFRDPGLSRAELGLRPHRDELTAVVRDAVRQELAAAGQPDADPPAADRGANDPAGAPAAEEADTGLSAAVRTVVRRHTPAPADRDADGAWRQRVEELA